MTEDRTASTSISGAARKALGMTHSVCSRCRQIVPGKVVSAGQDVFLVRFCPDHGEAEALIWHGLEEYLARQRSVKPAWQPLASFGDASAPCPEGCGFCDRHEQHLCLPIIDITSRCNLECPVCLVSAGGSGDMTAGEFRVILDALCEAEAQVDVLNLSGGEPLLHPGLLALIDEALGRSQIVRVSISTNGLVFLEEASLVHELKARDVIVALQLDGFSESIYRALRGRSLLGRKLRSLDTLGEVGITTSLTMTAAGGVNDDQFGSMLDLLFSREHIVSMMVQPLAFAGRASAMRGRLDRLTIPDIVRRLGGAGHPAVSADDFVPLPCCHPLCYGLAFYLMLDDGTPVSLHRLTDRDTMLESVANRVFFGLDPAEQERLKEMIYELWSAPSAGAPDSDAVLATLRQVLRELSAARSSACCFDPRKAFAAAERRVKSIFIHAFQDEETFDLARVRRCCNAYPQPDGRLVPGCVHNVIGRPPAGSPDA